MCVWLVFFSCAPRAPQNQCWHREASCFSSTWSRTHARSTLNGGGRGDGSTTWKSEVKYWPLLWVASSFLSKSSDSIETCRALYDSETTTHKHTRLHFKISFRCKQHVAHAILPCNFQTGLGGRWFLGDSIFQDAFAYSWFLVDGRLLAGGRHLADSKEAATWELLLGLKKTDWGWQERHYAWSCLCMGTSLRRTVNS